MSERTSDGKRLYSECLHSLNETGPLAFELLTLVSGQQVDRSSSLASAVFEKICAHSRSILAITESQVFDHSAIIAVSRMVMEGTTMFFYLREKVGQDVWSFRDLVLRLRITTTQIASMRAFQDKQQTDSYRKGRETLIAEIQAHSCYGSCTAEQQTRIASGTEIYVGGMRKAAMNTGVWRDEAMFTSVYSYFSSHAHSAPLSFFNMQRLQSDYDSRSEYKLGLAAFGLEVATRCLRRVMLRYLDDALDRDVKLAARLDGLSVEQHRKDDNNYGVVFSGKAQI